MESKLNKQEETFCIQYLEHFNATKAYKDNFNCEGLFSKNITRRANYLLQNYWIQRFLKKRMDIMKNIAKSDFKIDLKKFRINQLKSKIQTAENLLIFINSQEFILSYNYLESSFNDSVDLLIKNTQNFVRSAKEDLNRLELSNEP